ncbi:MAG: YqaJ viral recombinase family protein [Methylococcaceae bacterium]
MITEEQKQARKNFIGASDAAAAIGLNPYKTPLDVYLEKTGQVEPFAGNEATYWGNLLEPMVAIRYELETGLKLRKHGMTIVSKIYPFMGCHIDRKVTGQPVVVEIKTGGFWTRNDWGGSGTDQIPDSVLVQVTHQMIVTDFKKALVAVLLGGQEFRHYEIEFDDSLAQIIIDKEQAFWQYVVEQTPPPPTTQSDLKQLYPSDNGESITATPDIEHIVEALKTAKDIEKIAAGNVDGLELELKSFIGNNTTLVDGKGQTLASWKAQTTNRIDTSELKKELPEIAAKYTKATESRVLRIK